MEEKILIEGGERRIRNLKVRSAFLRK